MDRVGELRKLAAACLGLVVVFALPYAVYTNAGRVLLVSTAAVMLLVGAGLGMVKVWNG